MLDIFSISSQRATGDLPKLDVDDYRNVHLAALRILGEAGVFVEDHKALAIFKSAGAVVDKNSQMVKLPSCMIEDAICSAPRRVRLAGRSDGFDVQLEKGRPIYVNAAGNVKIADLLTGAVRPSSKKDLIDATRLCDALNEVGVFSRAVYPLDQPFNALHLHTAEVCFNHTAKHCFHGPESKWQTEKIIEMASAVMGGKEALKARKPISFVCSVTSPLKLTRKFCEVCMASADAGFCTVIGSMVIGGGTGPVDLAGTLVQTNAEILAGIVLAQLIRKGVPVIYASFSTGMDLKVGTAPLGSPETAIIAAAVAALCQYYQIPCMVPGMSSDSKQPGSQAAFEKALTCLPAARAEADLIIGMGGLESGLTFDLGQAALDAEFIRMVQHTNKKMDVNTETLSVDLIKKIGPIGNYLSHESTLRKMRSMSQVRLFDRFSREEWQNRHKPESYQKALSWVQDILERHNPEPLPGLAAKKIRAIVEEAEKITTLKS